MKALGLWQPYAWLIREGLKTVETRFWTTAYRGKVLICSTKHVTKCKEIAKIEQWLKDHYIVNNLPLSVFEDVGTMQCTADVVDCRICSPVDETLTCCDTLAIEPHSGLAVRKWGIVLENIVPVVRKPIKCGRRWFDVDDALVEIETT